MAKFGVSMPEEVLKELDSVAEGWFTDRSKAIVRVFIEWKQLQKLAQFPQFQEQDEPNLEMDPSPPTDTTLELSLAA